MHIEVNEAKCEGHGLCEATAPSIYQLDDDGLVHLIVEGELSADAAAAAEAGARVCPVAALKVVS